MQYNVFFFFFLLLYNNDTLYFRLYDVQQTCTHVQYTLRCSVLNCNTLQCSVLASMIYYYLAQLVSDAYNACLRHFTAPHFTASCLTDNDIVLFMFLIAQNKTSMDVTSSTCSVQPCDTVFSAQKDSNITKISALLLLEQYAQLISFLDQFDYYCCHYFIFI